MRILKFFVIPAVLLFAMAAAADIIGPHGETPHHYFSPEYFMKRDLPIYLSVDKAPPSSALVFVEEGSHAAEEAWCTGSGPCSMALMTAGNLYLAPEGVQGGVKDFGPSKLLRLVRKGKLDYLMTFKGKNQSYRSRMSCYLEKKGASYTMKCRP